jgi:hypothetical protein
VLPLADYGEVIGYFHHEQGATGDREHHLADSDASGMGFRFESGRASDVKPATIPI